MRKKRRMFWHLYPYYLMIILLSLIVVTGYASTTMREYILDEIAEDLNIRARLLERQFVDYLTVRDAKQIDQACKSFGTVSATRVTVILPNGSVIGDSHEQPEAMDNHGDRPEFRAAMANTATGASVRYSKTLRQNMMYVAVALHHDKRLVGALRTSISIAAIDEKLKDIQRKIAVGGLFIALIAAAVSLFISRRISRPVEELKKGAERFSGGDLEQMLPIPDYEEIGSLAETMNEMAVRLDDRIKAVVRRRNELEAVLSSMAEGVLAVDKEERIITYNRAFSELFDCAVSTLTGRNIQEIIRSAELQRFIQEALISVERKKADVTIYIPNERIIRIDSAPLPGALNEQIGALFVLNDVTQIKLLENMRRDFAINVSHEIKTPLTAIKGFVETLLDEPDFDPQGAKKFLKIIQRHVDRLTHIVEDLKSLTQIEDAGEKMAIALESTDIHAVILNAVQCCQEKALEKKIQIEWSCEDGIFARINPPLLERALVNLIDNAINYSDSDASIQISAAAEEEGVVIKVKDSGIGIPRKYHQRIFERFYRVDKARSRDSGGSGLGLAIVKHIILSHGGRISLDSLPDKGSCFEIRLPGK